MSTVESLVTPEELLLLPDAVGYELLGGQLVERNVSHESSWIGGELYRLLANYCDATRIGWAFPSDASYQCFADDPSRVRRPDVSFIRREQIERFGLPIGHSRFPPDLAVEVFSPHDRSEELSEKVRQYLSAGVRLVWVVDPVLREVFVHRPAGGGVILSSNDDLDGEDVVPGFRCKVGDLFRRLNEIPSSG
jgi:Uma2 family endonuclease